MTNKPLQSISLSARMAERLEADIRAGVWTNELPGYRVLAERYGTGNKTAIAALEILEQRKVIEAATQGSRRCVSKRVANSKKALDGVAIGSLLILYPSEAPMTDDWPILIGCRDTWIEAGGTVTMIPANYTRYKHPRTLLKSLIQQCHAEALVLCVPPEPWVRASVEQLPTYLLGGEWPDILYTACGFDLRNEVEGVFKELAQLGHRRVLVPVESHLPAFRKLIMSAARKFFGETNKDLAEQLCPVFYENVPAVWQDYWARAFSRTTPTAVVVTTEMQLLSLYSYCMARRIEIPAELSVVVLSYSSRLEWLHPAPRQMQFPPKHARANFRKWIRSGLRPAGIQRIKLDVIAGASVARARSDR